MTHQHLTVHSTEASEGGVRCTANSFFKLQCVGMGTEYGNTTTLCSLSEGCELTPAVVVSRIVTHNSKEFKSWPFLVAAH